ncbi:MAG: hypothetical protein HY445_00900 [Candidatus Niyogibacteria bacterium]|nr:hypothetical protein [Candidatus Niyogibacteria bacterium]
MRHFIVLLFFFVSLYAADVRGYDFGSFGGKIKDLSENFSEKLAGEFMLEAKYFLLMMPYQNTENALTNEMPKAFCVFLKCNAKIPALLKRMLVRAMSRTIDAETDHFNIFGVDDSGLNTLETKLFEPAIYYTFWKVKVGLGANIDLGEDINFTSLKHFPVKPIASLRIQRKPFSATLSYDIFKEQAKIAMRYRNRDVALRQDISTHIHDLKNYKFSSDLSYKVFKNIYAGVGVRINTKDERDTAGVLIIYGFW